MNRLPDENDFDWLEFAELERKIRAAGGYVAPSDDLRPRILEVARERCSEQRHVRRASWLAMATISLWVACWPLSIWASGLREKLTAPSSSEIQSQAIEHSQRPNGSFDWGLVEAFDRLDSLQIKSGR